MTTRQRNVSIAVTAILFGGWLIARAVRQSLQESLDAE